MIQVTAALLLNRGKGVYKTDSLDFKGVAGRTYVLHIKTGEGMEYESDPCLMHPGSEIDSIYFIKDFELVNNGTETRRWDKDFPGFKR